MEDFGKVAVFCGGRSSEREISLQSGAAVAGGLEQAGLDTQLIDVVDYKLDLDSFDRVFIALHGKEGEDGTIQALLDYYDIPYTGSRMPASALSMNKWHTKAVWKSIGINTPNYQIVGDIFELDINAVQFPVYVKPVNGGSSIGITYVLDSSLLDKALSLASEYDELIMIEQAVQGQEYTYSFIDGASDMPLIHLEPAAGFYDYEAKYIREDTRYIVAPPMDKNLEEKCISESIAAYKSIGMSGWGRIDFMVDKNNEMWFIEANSVPGMTNHSLVPMAAQSIGLDFSATCIAILRSSMYG